MNRFLLMGLFALLVVGISLWRVLAEKDLNYFARIKSVWGRTFGLGLHFMTNVGLPLIVGVVFISKGVVSFDPRPSEHSFVKALPEVQTIISQAAKSRVADLAPSRLENVRINFELLMP